MKEDKKEENFEMEVDSKASKIAVVVMLILTTIYYIYDIVTTQTQNPALYSLITSFCTVMYGYRAIKISEKRKINSICAIIWGIITVMLMLEFFGIL